MSEGWVKMTPGLFIHPEFGVVERDGRRWMCVPNASIARSPYDTFEEAMSDCERNAHIDGWARRRIERERGLGAAPE